MIRTLAASIHLPPVRTFSRAIVTRPRFTSAAIVRMLKPFAVKSVCVAPSAPVAAITRYLALSVIGLIGLVAIAPPILKHLCRRGRPIKSVGYQIVHRCDEAGHRDARSENRSC